MRAILKVVRCNVNKFRMGIHIVEQDINTQNIKHITIVIDDSNTIEVQNIKWFNKYSSIVNGQLASWIIANSWTHDKRTPMKLIKFNIELNDDKVIFWFMGPSSYRKVPNRRMYIIEGQTKKNARRLEDEINTLWNQVYL